MPRTRVRYIVRDDDGPVFVNARVYPRLVGTVTALNDAFPTLTGGVAAESFVTNGQGEVEFFTDKYREEIDLYVTDNGGTTYQPGGTAGTFAAFPETVTPTAPTGTLVRLPQATDRVVYVGRGTAASDANDGLTAYSAKATIAAAIAALGGNGGLIKLGWGVFAPGFTVPDNVIVEGVGFGSSIEGSAVDLVTMAGRSVLRDCLVKDNNAATGSATTVGVRIASAGVGIWKWKLERVFILGSLGPGVSAYVGTGLLCDFALEGQVDGCVIEFWNEGVRLQNSSNANAFTGCKVRQNNTGLRAMSGVGGAVSTAFLQGCTIEGNDTGIRAASLRLTATLNHFENNTGATPTNIVLDSTCQYIGLGNEFNAAAANRDIVVSAGNTASHRSYGELFNSGITHSGTGTFVLHEPYLDVARGGTGPYIQYRNGAITGTNASGRDLAASGFNESTFAQPVRFLQGAVSGYLQADSAGARVLIGTLSNHLVDLIVGYTVALRLRTDAAIATEETAMVLRVNKAGVISNQTVKLGASGTGPGGVGRMLYTDG